MSISVYIREEKFYHYFQPIYNLNSMNKIGFEALLRSKVHANPETVFKEAIKEKRLYELDSISIHNALYTYQSAGFSQKEGALFLNIFPSTILNRDFSSFLNKISTENYLDKQQIVLEICESESIDEFETFKERIIELKKQGFLIAIDDIGKGYSNFELVIELEPDYLKLDRYFSKDLHLSKKKQRIISFFLNYCEEEKIRLILEGLEDNRDLVVAKALGVKHGQGYILGRPALLKELMLKQN
ncbi:EAL domain-containing protein [Bacillus solitudinis]|uniref:EAL domain-containing protein n=1 Tax=Bacillus solitudinis TaxID=2014074 RepID=UPI0012FE1FFB|nr:EAL domain-containing protein [Bacillus solitudinis]